MKKILLAALFASFLSQIAVAGTYSGTGLVSKLDTRDLPAVDGKPAKIESTLRVSGFSYAGTCYSESNHVRIVIKNDDLGDRMFSAALAAKFAGKEVTVLVDEAMHNNASVVHGTVDSCYLQQIRIAQ